MDLSSPLTWVVFLVLIAAAHRDVVVLRLAVLGHRMNRMMSLEPGRRAEEMVNRPAKVSFHNSMMYHLRHGASTQLSTVAYGKGVNVRKDFS